MKAPQASQKKMEGLFKASRNGNLAEVVGANSQNGGDVKRSMPEGSQRMRFSSAICNRPGKVVFTFDIGDRLGGQDKTNRGSPELRS